MKFFLEKAHIEHVVYTHSDGDKLVPSVQKKINELEVGLLHLQQNIDIPEISLPIHPTIQGVVKKAGDGSRKATVEDLSGSLGDTTFLNALQKDVSRWIREIQKVRLSPGVTLVLTLEGGRGGP
jgi:dynein heavy chain 1